LSNTIWKRGGITIDADDDLCKVRRLTPIRSGSAFGADSQTDNQPVTQITIIDSEPDKQAEALCCATDAWAAGIRCPL
jgi:hypothetical protein